MKKFNVNTIISHVRLSVGLMSRYFEVLNGVFNMDQCVCHRTINVNTEDVFFVISFFSMNASMRAFKLSNGYQSLQTTRLRPKPNVFPKYAA